MEFQSVLENRRSIRKYDGSKSVTKEQIEEIIRAGILAPSWKNSQVPRYYAAITEGGIAKVKEQLASFNVQNTEGAAYIVTTIVADRSGCERDGTPTTEMLHNEWGMYDLGLASENMVLKAADLGLGTLIMGIRDAAGLKEALQIPKEEIVVAVIGIGYPAIEPVMPKRKEVGDVTVFL